MRTTGIHRPPEDVDTSGHSILAPSSAGVWGPCPGSLHAQLACAGDYEEDVAAADEGEQAHAVGSDAIDLFARALGGGDPTCALIDSIEGIDAPAVGVYINDVVAAMRKYAIFGGPNFAIEQTLLCEAIHPLCFGTPDMWIYSRRDKRLIIWDFKYGWGLVDVYENKQLITYASGILQLLGIGPHNEDVIVDLRVVQPRPYHPDGPVRTWRTTPAALEPYWTGLIQSAQAALGPDPLCIPGEQCHYCKARHKCGSARTMGLDAVDYIARPTPHNVPAERLGRELDTLLAAEKAIKYHRTGVEERIKSLVKRGTTVPGYLLGASMGNLEWTAPAADLIAMDARLARPQAACTPTQAIAMGIDKAVVNAMAKRTKRGMKLVRDDGSAARKAFGK